MAKFTLAFLFLLVAVAVARNNPFEDLKCFKDLKPKDPKIVFQGDGGMIEMWTGDDFPAMNDAKIVAGRITIKPGAFVMPAYVDIPAMKLVIQGTVDAGVVNPVDVGNKENTYSLKKGDVVALPSGVATWWQNNGDTDAIIICVGDITLNDGEISEKVFFLAGSKGKEKHGPESVVKGFSSKLLAQAWETSEGVVKKILDSQQAGGLVMPPKRLTDASSSDRKGRGDQDENQQNKINAGFVYHYADATPDFQVEKGGEVRELSSRKMPVLKYVGFGAECVRLSQGAMVAPNYFLNGHQFIYVHEGTGKLQVVNNYGERALDMDLMPGSVAVVPKTFASIAVAGPDGMDFVSVLTTHTPVVSFLAGNNSVFSAMPADVVSAAFNIDPETTDALQQTGSNSMVIVPPKKV